MATELLEKMNADLASLVNEARPLAEKSATAVLTADEDQRFSDLVRQINEQREQITAAEQRAASSADILSLNQHLNKPKDSVKRGVNLDTASEPKAGYKSPGTALTESEAYKAAVKSGHLITRHSPVELPGFFGPEAQKAVIGSATAPASALFAQVLPSIYRGAEAPLVLRDVLMNLSTNSDTVTVMQESGFTNSAAEVAEATTTSDGAKPESALTFTEASFPVRIIAHWIPVTRQLLEDLAFMEGYINERLLTGLRRREDAQFLNGNGTAPNLRGILNTSGIQSLTTAGEFTTSAVKDAGTANENLNRLRRAIRKIRWTALADPSFIVLNPADAEELDTITDSTRQYLIGGPLAPAQRRIWGLPVVESANIAAKTALVGDGSMAAVVDRNQARIYTTDSHSDFFIRNLLVVLAEERVALPVFRPEAFASVQLA